jgi:aspartate kinase
MNDEVGLLWKALDVFRKLHISVDHCPGTVDSVSFVVATSELEGKRRLLVERLEKVCVPDAIRFRDRVALVCTVGLGMADTPGIAGKLTSALGKKNINIELLNQGGSEINIVVGVKEEEREAAIAAIYDAFVG